MRKGNKGWRKKWKSIELQCFSCLHWALTRGVEAVQCNEVRPIDYSLKWRSNIHRPSLHYYASQSTYLNRPDLGTILLQKYAGALTPSLRSTILRVLHALRDLSHLRPSRAQRNETEHELFMPPPSAIVILGGFQRKSTLWKITCHHKGI